MVEGNACEVLITHRLLWCAIVFWWAVRRDGMVGDPHVWKPPKARRLSDFNVNILVFLVCWRTVV